MKTKTIIILGAGSGGLVCANLIRKKLPNSHRVILIDKNENHIFTPSLIWLMFNLRKQDEIMRPLNKLKNKNIDFINGKVSEINIQNRFVTVNEQKFNYDYLIISLGAEFDKSRIPKLDNIFDFYCLEGAKLTCNAINNFSNGKIAILISATPFKCPAAPYETAFMLDAFYKNKKSEKISIELYTPETLPMPTAGPKIGNALKEMLKSRGINFYEEHKIKSIDNNKLIFENGTNAAYDLLLVVPPHRASDVVKQTNLVDESGWVPVDKETLKTGFENVYAIGDITSIKIPGKYNTAKPLNLPKAGVFAHYQAEVVSENIVNEINGIKESQKKFSGKGYCFIELGNNKTGFASGNFYSLPSPKITMYPKSTLWHWNKILFEKWWLWRWF
jgi:sulfide:quinone oxidoreductase